jgi:UDP-glucose 4-epimerase
MRVLITGGAGYIGSVLVEELLRDGHEVVVYDNLSTGHRESFATGAQFVRADLLQKDLLRDTLVKHGIEAVIHMAASSLVGESMINPAKYYYNNVMGGLSLLEAMIAASVKRLVFSSTAAVYGEPAKQPIEEFDPTRPTNPYGETKLVFERALNWFENAHGVRYTSLRYFNAAGASANCGESHDPETHLIPLVLQVAAGRLPHLEIYGADYPTRDGTCVRDYIHVIDLARAHILALHYLDERSGIFNLGCGADGHTVKEVVAAASGIAGKEIPVKVIARRTGDPAVLIASSDRAKTDLGWRPEFQDLRKMIGSAWSWRQAHPTGYGSGLAVSNERQ